MFGMIALFAEFEKNLIQEQTRAGLEAARKKGHTGCRPPLSQSQKGPAEDIEENKIKLLTIDSYKELKEIPLDTVEYYKIENKKGNRFGLFQYIPHVLSLGEVDIKDVDFINWNKPQ
ncbi:DNA invertase Pin-like site-specific DNA recombinase [Neobacillus sp. B4I6]|jgi:DNA invertase Pin-like site-specific DNA recombinase|uniref:recombinase family protein n=1 Tax=Neobacillus sp. B4I6 TaxID=3373925 RepID=UPI003D1C599E